MRSITRIGGAGRPRSDVSVPFTCQTACFPKEKPWFDIAWNYVAAADPDGYTLLMAENALGISQALYKKTSSSFDPVKPYDAIAVVATSPLVLAVANNVKANSVNELITYARAMPQKINYASAGIGSVSHLTFEVIKAGTGMDAVHVPYKGGGPAMNDVIA